MIPTRLLSAAILCICGVSARAGCPELGHLPANVANGQLSISGGVAPFGARAADDFFLPQGNGGMYSLRTIRAVLISNFPLAPTTVGLTIFDDAVIGSPPRPAPGRIAGGSPGLPPTVTDIGPFGATAPDGRPLRYYQVEYTLPAGAMQLPAGAWYWIAPFALGGAGASQDVAYAALHGPTQQAGLLREPVNSSAAAAPGAFIEWNSTAQCCLSGAYDLALYLDAEQAGAGGHAGPRSDFDCNGVLSVDDIFAFLGAWFASAPEADFNGTGGVTVQDIFDYLGAWFAGI